MGVQPESLLSSMEGYALKKVSALPRPHLSHGFTRYGNNEQDDRLPTIFHYGIVSSEFAKKVGITTTSNFQDKQNDTHVSVNTDGFDATAFIPVKRYGQEPHELPPGLLMIMIINNLLPLQKVDKNAPKVWKLRRHRIAPRFFEGLVLYNTSSVERVGNDFKRVLNEDILNGIVEKMTDVYAHKPQLAIPIYDNAAGLIWPKRIEWPELRKSYTS